MKTFSLPSRAFSKQQQIVSNSYADDSSTSHHDEILNTSDIRLSPDQFLCQCFKTLQLSHVVIERNLFRKTIIDGSISPTSPQSSSTLDMSSDQFHVRYFKGLDSFTEWSQGSNLNPTLVTNSMIQKDEYGSDRSNYKSSLFQMIKSRLLLSNSKRVEFLNEVNLVKEVLALFWTRCGENDFMANRCVSFQSIPYVKQTQDYQSKAPNFMKEILRYVNIHYEPIENLLSDDGEQGKISDPEIVERTKIFAVVKNLDSNEDEFSRCVKRIFENHDQHVKSIDQFKTMLCNLDEYLDSYSKLDQSSSESLLGNYFELFSSTEQTIEEKQEFVKYQINQLYLDLFLYFQTACNEYLVYYLHEIRGFDHHEQDFKEIPQDLVVEKPFTIIELCPNHLRMNEKVNQNLKEKFSQFKERKKNKSLEVSYKELKNSFTKFGGEFSEHFERLLDSFQMHEMVNYMKRESDHLKNMNDSNILSVFSKLPLSYVFCLDSKVEDSKMFELLNDNQPELFELRELILSKFDKDKACEIPLQYIGLVNFASETTIFDSSTEIEKTFIEREQDIAPPVTTPKSRTKSEETTPKRKLFTIKKDPSRELKEIDMLEEEVKQLEQQVKEHQEIYARYQSLKQGQPIHNIRKDISLRMEEQTVKNRLETIITMGYSCLALCSIYKCESYRKKLSHKLEELSISLFSFNEEAYTNFQLITELETIIFEHSYYLGYQVPSLLTRLYGDSNCSKFKGYQRLFKYIEIVNSFPENIVIDISPLNVAEMLKLSTRKLQSDLEILTQVRHFKSISLYNSHETSCNIVRTITKLCRQTKYQSMIVLIMKEFNTIHVVSELLRLTLKHFDAFKDYILCLLKFCKEMAIRMLNPEENQLGENNALKSDETRRKESEILKSCFCSTSFAFNLILSLNYSVSKLGWNQNTIYDMNCFVSQLKSISEEEIDCSQIANESTFLLTYLLENDSLTNSLNTCNRLERLLPMTILKTIRCYRDLDLGRQLIKLLSISSKKISYSSNQDDTINIKENESIYVDSPNNEEEIRDGKYPSSNKVNTFLDNIEIEKWKFSFREIFMDGDAPPILLMILHKFVLNYLDDNVGTMEEEILELDHLKNEACKILPIVSQSLVNLLEMNVSAYHLEDVPLSPISVDSSIFETQNSPLVYQSEDQEIRKEIYSCLFYILLQCLLLERSGQNLQHHSQQFDLFHVGWNELIRLMNQSPEFRLCIEHQFILNIYLKELGFLQLILGAYNRKTIILRRNQTLGEKTRLESLLLQYDPNVFDNLDLFLQQYRQTHPPISESVESLLDMASDEHDGFHSSLASESGDCFLSPSELAYFVLKEKRLHTKSIETTHHMTHSKSLSNVETSCLKYTNQFFKHYDGLGVFDDVETMFEHTVMQSPAGELSDNQSNNHVNGKNPLEGVDDHEIKEE